MSAALSKAGEPRANRCGVAVFALDRWSVLDRFLVLGVTGQTYYATERELRQEHLFNLLACFDEDGQRAVARIVEISRAGRAPRNLPAVAALALAASVGLVQPKTGWRVTADRTGDTPARAATRAAALAALPAVCRIPTDLFAWANWIMRLRGWGPAVSKAVARWYIEAPIDRLVLHGIKYEARKGVAHADLIRLSHPRLREEDSERLALVRWLLAGGVAAGAEARAAALASGIEGNPTHSAALRQLEGAEDLLLVNRLGVEREAAEAAEDAAERARARAALAVERAHADALTASFVAEPPASERRRDETRYLFNVSAAMLSAALAFDPAANDYIGSGDVHEEAPEDRAFRPTRVYRFPSGRALGGGAGIARAPRPSRFKPDEVARAVDLIERCSLPHEVVPSQLKRERAVWDALLVDMPMGAMIRNLAVMTRVGLLEPGSPAAAFVASRLRDPVLLGRARIHPLALLEASATYGRGVDRPANPFGRGRGRRRRVVPLTWTPAPEVLRALDAAFHLAFQNVVPSNVRLMLGVDVSSSMDSAFIGDGWLTARSAAAAMCLVTARTEASWEAFAFTSGYREQPTAQVYPGLSLLPVGKEMSVAEAARVAERLPMGSTDCALTIRYALDKGIEVDAFVTYTDNEHNTGEMTPARALAAYRKETGIAARMVCVGMTATDYSVANAHDPLCLNVVGFDSAAPRLIADFAAGRV
jgi:hypothetical protein